MSHKELNIKLMKEIMSRNITDEEKDQILMSLISEFVLQGGYDMKKQSLEWFFTEYPNSCNGFRLLCKFREDM